MCHFRCVGEWLLSWLMRCTPLSWLAFGIGFNQVPHVMNHLFKTWRTIYYVSHSRKCRDVWESRVWFKLFLWTLVPYSLLSSEIFLDACEMLTKLSNEPKMSVSLELGVWSWIDICKIHKRGFFLLGVMKCEWFTRLTWFDLV